MEHITFTHNKKVEQPLFHTVLVYGAGPTSITTIAMVTPFAQKIVQMTPNLESERAYAAELSQRGGVVTSEGKIAGTGYVDEFYLGETSLQQDIEVIFLCIPNRFYASVVKMLQSQGIIAPQTTIVGISTKLGSQGEISLELPVHAENNVVSFSTYFGATKHSVPESKTRVFTRAVKNKIYVGFSRSDEELEKSMTTLLGTIGTKAAITHSNIEAELQNANTLIHAQIAIAPRTVPSILSVEPAAIKYLYRPTEEGALDMNACTQIAASEEDFASLLTAIHAAPVNLMRMLNEELYAVPTITAQEVESFPSASRDEKAALLYRWFVGRQKDPATGEPHLEQVKLQQVTITQSGKLLMPRIPAEDYEGLVLLEEVAHAVGIKVPTISAMINYLDAAVNDFEFEDFSIQEIRSHAREISKIVLQKTR